MVKNKCVTRTDLTKRELEAHGSISFPIAIYDEDLTIEKVGVHWHDEFEFIIASDGVLILHIDTEEVRLNKGEAIFINSGHLHSAEGHGKLKSLVFHSSLIGDVNSIFFQEITCAFLDNEKFSFLILNGKSDWEKTVIENMMDAYCSIENESYDYENESRYHITRAMRIINENSKVAQKIRKHDEITYKRIKRVLRYIDDNLQDDITINELSQIFSASESVLLKSFKQTVGTSPIQYILKKRIEKARYLIITTDKKICDIAIECGFNDMSYFAKQFKKIVGTTPKEYKEER